MSEKTTAVLNIGKALLGVSFTTLAAVGSAIAGMTGNFSSAALWAGLTVLPGASLTAYDLIKSEVNKIQSQEKEKLEVPIPSWWASDSRSWQNVCKEIDDRLPTILQNISQSIHQDHRVMTSDVVQQIFIDVLVAQHLTWAPDPEERRKIGEVISPLFLLNISQVLQPVIMQIQQEETYKDIRSTAIHTTEAAHLLREILDVVKPPHLSNEEIDILRQQYCNALYNRWKMLDFRGIMHIEMNRPKSLPLTEVFVFPDVLIGVPEYETIERDEEHKSDDNRKLEKFWEDAHRDVYEDLKLKKGNRVDLQREELPIALGKSRCLVLLGDPGAGKSTLLRYLLLRLTHEQDKFVQDFPQLTDASSFIPLYMPLAAFAEVWRFNPPGERSLADFLPKYMRENYPQVSITFILRQLEQGRVFLLFDGLDEIPDASLRNQVVNQIEVFTQAFPKNRFIITSRIVGYIEAPLPPGYQPYTIAPFNEKQIKLFTQKWCPAYELWVKGINDGQQHLQQEAEKLFQATQDNVGVKKLAANPLLLTILALIQRQGIELPNHRIKLFDLCITTLIDTWVKARGQHLDFDEDEMFETLRSLAFWMHERTAIGVIKEDDLITRIIAQLTQYNINEHEARRTARQFLSAVRGKVGILIERGEQRYGFLHQTFEEYFAARELVVRKKERNNFIKSNLHSPRWHEVILLALGTIGILQKDKDEATEIVDDAILQAGSPFEEWLHRDLLFAGFCLADDIRLNTLCEDKIIEQIIYLYLVSPFNSQRQTFSEVLRAWSGSRAGKKAAYLISSLFNVLETLTDGNIVNGSSTVQEKFAKYYQCIIQEYQKERIKLVHLQIMMILFHFQTTKTGLIVEYAFSNLSSSSDGDVRQAAAKALGQLGSDQPEVRDALLKALADSSLNVRQTAAAALAYLPTNRIVLGKHIEELLKQHQPLTRKQFVADPNIDALLSALQQIISEI